MKICTRCKVEKDREDFSKDSSRPDGLYSYCRVCTKSVRKLRCKKDRKQKSEYERLKRYGISGEEWESLFESQGRKCAICRAPNSGKRDWDTDHDHKTGKVRGILCSPCNTALGLFKDETGILQQAIQYLGSVS